MSKTLRTALLLFFFALCVRITAGVLTGLDREPVEDERGYVDIAECLMRDWGRDLALSGASCRDGKQS